MTRRAHIALTPDEARQLHAQALVIDTLFAGAASVPSPQVRTAFEAMARQGMNRIELLRNTESLAIRTLNEIPDAREAYFDLWRQSGVTAGLHTLIAAFQPPSAAYDATLRAIGSANTLIASCGGMIRLALSADDLEAAHRVGKHALLYYFQDGTPIGDDLSRIQLFYDLGVRSIQLTYNLRNLLGDGCLERNASGLSHFGIEAVKVMNDVGMTVDVSHCSEKVGWDSIECSAKPISINHTAARAVYDHPRTKSDELLAAVADKGGYIGVVVIPAFIRGSGPTTLEHVVDHVEHVVRVAGIDHVGIGTDMGSIFDTLPADVTWTYDRFYPPGFAWHGFKPEHRNWVGRSEGLVGYKSFADWPNITVALAQRGFNEEELRKLLGMNYLRFFREVQA